MVNGNALVHASMRNEMCLGILNIHIFITAPHQPCPHIPYDQMTYAYTCFNLYSCFVSYPAFDLKYTALLLSEQLAANTHTTMTERKDGAKRNE